MIGLDHIAITAGSRENTLRFYRDFLGLEELYSFSIPEEITGILFPGEKIQEVLVFGEDTFKLEVFIINESHPPAIAHFCLRHKRIEELIKQAPSLGVPVIKAWHKDHFVYFLKDFSGNMIEIKPA